MAMLTKNRRIAKSKDWQRLHRRGRTYHDQDFVVKVLKNNLLFSRFGVIVGTKVSKKATRRNRIKRQIRAIISEKMANMESGNDIILIARPTMAAKKYDKIKSAIIDVFKRAGIL